MTTRSGLDAQVGFKNETTVGTAVTPDHFVEFDTETFKYTPTWLEGEGIRAGSQFKRDSRVSVVRKDVNGKLDIKLPTKGVGLLVKHMMGSSATATQIGVTTAYKQIHTPGDHVGKGLTIQVGRPEPGTGTVRPHTFNGCKCTQWEFSVSDGGNCMLSTTWDGWNEDTATALASASYSSGANLFNFSHGSLTLGGTATTGSGEISVAGSTAVAAVVNSFTVRGEIPLQADRYGIGNAGVKSEQLQNDYPTITGSIDAEFAKVELYDVFKAASSTTLQANFSQGDAGGGNAFAFNWILPATRFKDLGPAVNGPGLVRMSCEFEVYDDGTNAVAQAKIVSTDTAL